MVVPTELVSSVNPTHIAVVQLDADWASDILNMAILGPMLHGGCSCGGHIRGHNVDQLSVSPCCHNQVAPLPILGLSPLELSWNERYVLCCYMHLSSISVYIFVIHLPNVVFTMA